MGTSYPERYLYMDIILIVAAIALIAHDGIKRSTTSPKQRQLESELRYANLYFEKKKQETWERYKQREREIDEYYNLIKKSDKWDFKIKESRCENGKKVCWRGNGKQMHCEIMYIDGEKHLKFWKK